MERRVDELKKEFDHAKEKLKASIVITSVQSEVITPLPSNGTSAVLESIGSTTPNKYVLFFLYFYQYINISISIIN